MSSTFDVVPFHRAHLLLLGNQRETWMQDPSGVLVAQANAGAAYTLLIDGRVAVCGGIARLWPGLGEAWSVISPIARQHPIPLTRIVKREIASMMNALALHRVQCFCLTSDQRATRWAEVLGFVREGTLKAYGPDASDHDVFAKVTHGQGDQQDLRGRRAGQLQAT